MKALRKTLVVLLVLLMVFGTLAFSGCSLRINKTNEDPGTQTTTAPPTDKPGNQLAVVETEVPVPATTAPATDTPVATYPPESTDGEKIIITKGVVTDGAQPQITRRKEKASFPVKLPRREKRSKRSSAS